LINFALPTKKKKVMIFVFNILAQI